MESLKTFAVAFLSHLEALWSTRILPEPFSWKRSISKQLWANLNLQKNPYIDSLSTNLNLSQSFRATFNLYTRGPRMLHLFKPFGAILKTCTWTLLEHIRINYSNLESQGTYLLLTCELIFIIIFGLYLKRLLWILNTTFKPLSEEKWLRHSCFSI